MAERGGGLLARSRLLLFLAARALRESPLSLVLLLGAVGAGVAFQIPSTANLDGYRAELLDQGVTRGAGDVRIRPPRGDRFTDAGVLIQRARAVAGVVSASAVITLPGAVGRGGHFVMLSVTGFDPGLGPEPFRIASGSSVSPTDHEGVLLGTSLARDLDAKLGDEVQLRVLLNAGPSLLQVADDNLGRYTLRVRGFVSGSFGASDGAFVSRAFLARETGVDDPATLIVVHGTNHDGARELASRVAQAMPTLRVRAWMDDSAYLRKSVSAGDAVGSVSRMMMILAVGIPVLGLLYINTFHKRRQIALLRAMGFSRGDVFTVFLLQALMVGGVGAALGTSVGYGVVRYLQAHPVFDWDNFVIRPVLGLNNIAWPVGIVMASALLAGVYPAWRAARVEPAQILRELE